MTGPNSCHFDRSKPFYPIIVNYVSQLVGFKELAVVGFTGPRELDEVLERASGLGRLSFESEQELATLRKQLQTLIGPLRLRSVFLNDRITVGVEDVAREIARGAGYLAQHLLAAAGGVFILAHELSKDEHWHDKGPLWEFLRHCRNAAAHGGRFNLTNGEPRRPAAWGRFNISPGLNGTPLFESENENGLLAVGDPIRLLWEIEQAYPGMRCN